MNENKKKILCFGDSLTEGWIQGGKLFHPYTMKLKSLFEQNGKSGYTIINEGISGEMVRDEMHKRLPKVLEKHNGIDLLVLQGGTNDILKTGDLKTCLDLFGEVKKLINIVQKFDVRKVCLLTIMEGYYTATDDAVMSHGDSNRIRMKCNEEVRSYGSQSDGFVTVCDMETELPLFTLDEDNKKLMWDDKIHPSISGYDRMAEIIYDHISDI